MKRCVIVGAGEIYSPIEVCERDFIIAADGGYKHLKNANISPDVLIGDFDSIDKIPQLTGTEIVRHPVEKDDTDMYLAYKLGVEKGFREFVIYGGVGGREDHTFANYCLLLYAKEEGNSVFLISGKAKVSLIKNEKTTVHGKLGKHLSLFPFGSDAEGVTVKGAEYECEKINLTANFPLTVSNIFKDTPVNIEVENGALLIMEEI